MTWECICGEELDDDVEFHTHPNGITLGPNGIEFMCCFCEKTVDRADIHTVVLTGPANTLGVAGSSQTWWCHRDCFTERLNETAQEYSWQ